MNRKPKRILLIVVLLVALLGLAGGVYFGTYSRATPEAAALLQGSDAVEVTALAEDGVDCFLVKMPLNMAFMDLNAAAAVQADYAYDRWYIGGHSLGGAMAAVYAAEHGEELSGLILLAAYATKPLDQHLAVLELHGSEDGVLNRDKLEQGRQYLPSSALAEELPGGNHAQFGDYGPQKGDGAATVSREEQTRWAVDRIEGMILGK